MRGLLFCNHEPTRVLVEKACRECGIDLTTHERAAECTEAVRAANFEVIVIDCDDTHGGPKTMRLARQSFANRRSGIIAILNGGTNEAEALDLGADLTSHKPISEEALKKLLRSAKQLSSPERRRHARTAVAVPVYVSFGDVVGRLATSHDISLGGIRLQMTETVQPDELLAIRFQLPAGQKPLQARGEIVWADDNGRVGVRFLSISDEARAEIRAWQKRAAALATDYAFAV